MKMAELNALSPEDFVARLSGVFEHSPWVAERAARNRPFASLDEICAAMNTRVTDAAREEQLALLRAHPDLGTRAKVSPNSAKEQSGVGLDRLTAEEFDRFSRLNAAYKEKFGFPFLYAVKGSDKYAIIDAMESRVNSNWEEEFEEALRQVFRIARFRLEEIVS
jgi:2-oxo-4-hydroxy-4-carboxy-5-ureidoimidazoline decarboxylase